MENRRRHQIYLWSFQGSNGDGIEDIEVIQDTDGAVPQRGWPSIVFSNYDQSRHIDRYSHDGDADRRAQAAAVLLFTLRGTPFLYYEEEIGMRNGRLRYRDLRDPYTKRYWPCRTGRDLARTPM